MNTGILFRSPVKAVNANYFVTGGDIKSEDAKSNSSIELIKGSGIAW